MLWYSACAVIMSGCIELLALAVIDLKLSKMASVSLAQSKRLVQRASPLSFSVHARLARHQLASPSWLNGATNLIYDGTEEYIRQRKQLLWTYSGRRKAAEMLNYVLSLGMESGNKINCKTWFVAISGVFRKKNLLYLNSNVCFSCFLIEENFSGKDRTMAICTYFSCSEIKCKIHHDEYVKPMFLID